MCIKNLSLFLIIQLIVFVNMCALHRFWGSVEYRRFNLKKSGLFPDNTFNCSSAFAAVEALGRHLTELAVRMLHGARTDTNHRDMAKPLLNDTDIPV